MKNSFEGISSQVSDRTLENHLFGDLISEMQPLFEQRAFELRERVRDRERDKKVGGINHDNRPLRGHQTSLPFGQQHKFTLQSSSQLVL